jgi:hypothetical protein
MFVRFVGIAAVLGFSLGLGSVALIAQDGDGGHAEKDPYKCPKCRPALEKAVSYVRGHYKSDGLAGHVYAGLMFLIMGDTGADFQACVSYATRAVENSGFNRNWYLGMCLYFLSEVYLRYPTPEVHNAMVKAVNSAPGQQETTGGWCHHKEMWKKNNYNKIGGGKDLGMVTSMVFGAFWNMKAAGMPVPKGLFDKVEKNLESIHDGFGICYGTDNKWGDITMSRISYVFMGMTNARAQDHPWHAKIVEGLQKRFKSLEKGHAFAPLHHYSVAAAMSRAGLYDRFAAEWIDRLIAEQKPDGTISLKCDRADKYADWTANAACLAIMLLLQKPGIFEPKGKEVKGPAAGPGAGGGSPFGRKEEEKDKTPIQSTGGSNNPTDDPSKKKSPYGK